MQQGKIDDAIPEFVRTMELDPGMPQGKNDLIQALRSKGIDPSGLVPPTGSIVSTLPRR